MSFGMHQFGILMSAGTGGVALLLPVVERKFAVISTSNVPLELSVSFPALAGAIAVSLVTILISAYIPAGKTAAVPVMECIRQSYIKEYKYYADKNLAECSMAD